MKARLVMLMVVVALCSGVSSAWAGSFGLGIILGEPTGLSFKQWVTGGNAVDAAAAWSFNDPSAFHVHMDYLYHWDVESASDLEGLKFYFGIGGRLKAVEGDSRIGARLPIGLDYTFSDAPMDLFFEVAPILDLVPGTEFRVNGGLGIRYFF